VSRACSTLIQQHQYSTKRIENRHNVGIMSLCSVEMKVVIRMRGRTAFRRWFRLRWFHHDAGARLWRTTFTYTLSATTVFSTPQIHSLTVTSYILHPTSCYSLAGLRSPIRPQRRHTGLQTRLQHPPQHKQMRPQRRRHQRQLNTHHPYSASSLVSISKEINRDFRPPTQRMTLHTATPP
jgi:hypothetical protein